jgi:predicted permease
MMPIVNYTIVSPDFFGTLGTPLEHGRDLQDSDLEDGQAVAVINRSMARQFWPAGDALGKQVVVPAERRPITIVGIVADTKHASLREKPSAEMFVPYTQDVWPSMSMMQVVLRSRTDPEGVIGGVRAALHSLDAGLPLTKVTTLAALTENTVSRERFSMLLLGFFGGFALVLAAVGIYGVISYSVGQQTREIGIRMALGAPRSTVFGAILSHGLRLAALGIGFGVVAALCVTHALTSYLYGVKAYDLLTFKTVAVVLACISLLAGVVPAQRAASIDPMQALRAE